MDRNPIQFNLPDNNDVTQALLDLYAQVYGTEALEMLLSDHVEVITTKLTEFAATSVEGIPVLEILAGSITLDKLTDAQNERYNSEQI